MFKKALVIVSAVAMLLCAVCVFTVATVSAEDTALQASVKAALYKEMKANHPVAGDFTTNNDYWHGQSSATSESTHSSIAHWVSDLESGKGVHLYNKGANTASLGFDWKAGSTVKIDGLHMVFGPMTWYDDAQARLFGIHIGAKATVEESWGSNNFMIRIDTAKGTMAFYANGGWAAEAFTEAQIVKDMETYTTMISFDYDASGALVVTLSNSNGDYATGKPVEAAKFPSAWEDHTTGHVGITTSNTNDAYAVDLISIHDGDATCSQEVPNYDAVKANYGVTTSDFANNNDYWASQWGQYGLKINSLEQGAQIDILPAGSATLGYTYNNEVTTLNGALIVVANVSNKVALILGGNKGDAFPDGSMIRFDIEAGNVVAYPGAGGDKLVEDSDVIRAMAEGETGIYFSVDGAGNVSLIFENKAGVAKSIPMPNYGALWTDHTKAFLLFATHDLDQVESKIDVLAIRNGDAEGAADDLNAAASGAGLAKIIAEFKSGAKDDADIFPAGKWTSNQGGGDDANNYWGAGGAGGYVAGSYTGTGCEASVNADGTKHVYVGNAVGARFIAESMDTYAPDGLTLIIKNLQLDGDVPGITLEFKGDTVTWVVLKKDGTADQMYNGWGGPAALTVTGGDAIKGLFDGLTTKFVVKKNTDGSAALFITNENGASDEVAVQYCFSTAVGWAEQPSNCTIGLGRWESDTYGLQFDVVAVYSGKNGTTVKAEEKAAAKALTDRIAAIGQVTADSEDTIEGIEADYAAANDRVKAQVSNYATLTEARSILDAILGDNADNQAANNAMDLINAIGEVTTESGAAIEAAEQAYAGLSDLAKSIVTNYATLTAARKKYDTLNEAAKYDGLKQTLPFEVKLVDGDLLNFYANGIDLDNDNLNDTEHGIALDCWKPALNSWGGRIAYANEVALNGLQIHLKNLDHLVGDFTVAMMDNAGSWVDLKGSMIRFTFFPASEGHPNGYVSFVRHNGSLSGETLFSTDLEKNPFTAGEMIVEFEVADETNVAVFVDGQFVGLATQEWLGLGTQDDVEGTLEPLTEAAGFPTFNYYNTQAEQYFSVYAVTGAQQIKDVADVEALIDAIGALGDELADGQSEKIDAAEAAYKALPKALRKYVDSAKVEAMNAAIELRDGEEETEEPTSEPTSEETVDYVAIVRVEINPSFDLYVDAEGKVVDVKPLNADAESIIDEISFEDLTVAEVVNNIVEEAVEAEFLTEDNADVTITVYTTEEATFDAEDLVSEVEQAVSEKVSSMELSFDVEVKIEVSEEPLNPKTGEAVAVLPIAMLIVAAGAVLLTRKRKED